MYGALTIFASKISFKKAYVEPTNFVDISKLPQPTEITDAITEQQKKDIDNADIEIKKIEAERSLLEQKEKTAKAETEKMQTQLTLIKEYKELGLTNEQIKKLLGL